MSASAATVKKTHPGEQLLYGAIVASLLFHLLAFGTYELGRRYHWMQKISLPRWLKSTPLVVAELQKKQPPKPNPPHQDTPQMFLEVDPDAATLEPPKNAKYYSSKNSQAANLEAAKEADTPKIDGSQTHVPKTETTPRAKPVPLQPAPPKPEPEPPVAKETEPKPKGGPQAGDLALAKPAEQPGETQTEETPKPAHKRPTTLTEAKLRQEIAGQKMKQDGGVHRHRLDSLDAQATPFGEYDRELVEAVSSHWDDLLQRKDFSRDRSGKVVVEFTLDYNGRVTNLHVVENGVGELLGYVCERAILDPAPFAPWPADMRRIWDSDQRVVRFAFFYE